MRNDFVRKMLGCHRGSARVAVGGGFAPGGGNKAHGCVFFGALFIDFVIRLNERKFESLFDFIPP